MWAAAACMQLAFAYLLHLVLFVNLSNPPLYVQQQPACGLPLAQALLQRFLKWHAQESYVNVSNAVEAAVTRGYCG